MKLKSAEQLTQEFRDGRIKISIDAGTPGDGVAARRGRNVAEDPEIADARNDHGQGDVCQGLPAVRNSVTHCVVDREAGFEAKIVMVDGKVVAMWRPITVSEKQWKFGGYLPKGGWRSTQ